MPWSRTMALTGESEKLIGMKGNKALVTLVTSLKLASYRIANYREKRDNDVSRERSESRSGCELDKLYLRACAS